MQIAHRLTLMLLEQKANVDDSQLEQHLNSVSSPRRSGIFNKISGLCDGALGTGGENIKARQHIYNRRGTVLVTFLVPRKR